MRVITGLDFKLNHHTAVCIGKFDGLHRGHRTLIQAAKRTGLTTVLITFLIPDSRTLYSYEEKKYLAEKLGVDILIAIPVTPDFMRMQPETFVENILIRQCRAEKICVGSDFRFGYRRRGDVNLLQKMADENLFSVEVFEKVKQNGEIISSTKIRERLEKGEIREVNELLGTPYFLQATVVSGNKLGRKKTVPTANLIPEEGKILPPFGVYAIKVQADGRWYQAVGNLGVKPTVPGNSPAALEVWLFDYDGNLYGEKLTACFYEFQRPEKKFSSMEELKQQIEKDTVRAKEILLLQGDAAPF